MKVIVIQIDGLQLAALGAYGSVWVETPNLDRLAASSVVFDQHFADVPSAAGVAHAMLGGRQNLPPMEGEREIRRGQSVFELLLSRKVFCYASNDTTPDSVFDVDNLPGHLLNLTTFDDVFIWSRTHVFPPWDVPPDHFARQCEDWEFEDAPEPWPDPAPGWLDPADDVAFARLQRTYVAVVEGLDEKIGQWLDVLSQQPWWSEAMLIFTAGRGQNLGEHGLLGDYRPWLHEELVHLPLMIRLPNDAEAGRRVFALTQTVDFPVTILDCFGIAKPDDWHGSSLLPLCRGDSSIRNYACMGLRIDGASEYAFRTIDATVILPRNVPSDEPPRAPMFFIKPDDRWEVNDLRQAHLEEAERLEQLLCDQLAARGLAGEAASGQSV
jgi:arylsulfatase A-like enzyme